MDHWKKFKTFKQRGEWVELEFMAAASLRGYHVLKPCGDNLNYDVAIDHRGSILRVQVKGFSARKGQGYLARLRHGGSGKQRYSPADLDLFRPLHPALARLVSNPQRRRPPTQAKNVPHALPRRFSPALRTPHPRPRLRTLPRRLAPPHQVPLPTLPPLFMTPSYDLSSRIHDLSFRTGVNR
jgi:hypothetical protein